MSQQPNILFVMTDQQRWDTLGCTHHWVHTPNLDALVAAGAMVFSNAVTNAPVCMPARVSLATGRYPHNFGLWRNGGFDLPLAAPTWMKAVREQGYRTSLFGKAHLHRRTNDIERDEAIMQAYGFDDVYETVGPRGSMKADTRMTRVWQEKGLLEAYREDFRERLEQCPHLVRPSALPLEYYYDVYVARQARDYLAAYDRPQPWCCTLSFGGPHEPWDAPEPYASRHDPAQMPQPVAPVSLQGVPRCTLRRRMRRSRSLTPAQVAAMRANYAGSVNLIDEQIGEVLRVVRERGEWDNTVVVFTSDHGEMNGDHGLIYKNTFLDGAVRIPLLVKFPGQPSPAGMRRDDALVELIDVGATLADIAGATPDYQQFGRSLLPRLTGTGGATRDYAVSEFQGEFMVINQRYKMYINRFGQVCLLFDLRADPDEQRNLARGWRARKIIRGMRENLLEHLVTTPNYSPDPAAPLPDWLRR